MAGKTISILEGNTFIVSDRAGNIDASPVDTQGLFAWDTRFLSRWVLTVDGETPQVLSTDDLDYFSAQFFLVPGTGTVYVDADLSIMRKRSAGNGFREELLVRNEKSQPKDLSPRGSGRLRRSLRGQRCAVKERRNLPAGHRRATDPGLPA